jgi:hypothetical protein
LPAAGVRRASQRGRGIGPAQVKLALLAGSRADLPDEHASMSAAGISPSVAPAKSDPVMPDTSTGFTVMPKVVSCPRRMIMRDRESVYTSVVTVS